MNTKDKIRKVVELMTAKIMKEQSDDSDKNYNINEYNNAVAMTVVKELIDDMITFTEMHIDSNYGNMNVKQFKKMWSDKISKIQNKIDNAFGNMPSE